MVNTFLPYADFTTTARCLDYRRLGKQRVEAMQLIKVIENPDARGWKNHPATAMWRGYVDALKAYFNVIVREWIDRGYKNNLALYDLPDEIEMPWWLGSEDFHYSHQASLLRKDAKYYTGKFDLPDKYIGRGYVWPKMVDGRKILEFSPISGKQVPKAARKYTIPRRFRPVVKI